jgi:hypothetical protein
MTSSAIRYFALLAALVLVAPVAQAQIMWMDDNDAMHFDWRLVRQWASKPLPADPKRQRDAELIRQCRELLAARHDGWVAATTRSDPIPPEPMMRTDDSRP